VGAPWLRSKREAKEQGGDGEREELRAWSPGKIPRRRITTARAGPQSACGARCESLPAQSQRSPGRAALLQAETLFLVFRFFNAPGLAKAGAVCSAWRAAAADARHARGDARELAPGLCAAAGAHEQLAPRPPRCRRVPRAQGGHHVSQRERECGGQRVR
jgi:hypothetical protein